MPAQIRFIDTSKDVKKTLEGLSKSALRASAKLIRKKLKAAVPQRTQRLSKQIGSWVFIKRDTGQPQMQIGFMSKSKMRDKGKIPAREMSHWLEAGTRPHSIIAKNAKVLSNKSDKFGTVVAHPGIRANHMLRNSVYENIAEIRKAQEQYLSALSDAIEAAKAKMDEGNEEVEDD